MQVERKQKKGKESMEGANQGAPSNLSRQFFPSSLSGMDYSAPPPYEEVAHPHQLPQILNQGNQTGIGLYTNWRVSARPVIQGLNSPSQITQWSLQQQQQRMVQCVVCLRNWEVNCRHYKMRSSGPKCLTCVGKKNVIFAKCSHCGKKGKIGEVPFFLMADSNFIYCQYCVM